MIMIVETPGSQPRGLPSSIKKKDERLGEEGGGEGFILGGGAGVSLGL